MIRIAPLHEHPGLWPALAAALEAQWPDWYGPGGRGAGRALADVQAYAQAEGLPAGLLMVEDASPIGLVAIKTQALDTHPALTPMLGPAWVRPDRRGKGLGARLLQAGEALAAQRGVATLYSATHDGARLFGRAGWALLETVTRDGRPLHLFCKRLSAGSAPA